MKDWPGSIPDNIREQSATLAVGMAGSVGYICYVDDSKTSAYVTKKLLKEQGYEVDHFTSAEPAIVAILENDYDLLITDLTLDTNGMDGDDLVRFVRKSGHPRKKRMPILVVTGNSDKDTLLHVYEAGANGILNKPISAEVLSQKIEELLPEKPITKQNLAYEEEPERPHRPIAKSSPQVMKRNGQPVRPATAVRGRQAPAKATVQGVRPNGSQTGKITQARHAQTRQAQKSVDVMLHEANPFTGGKRHDPQAIDPVSYHDIHGDGRNATADLTSTLTGAVRNAVGKLGEKSREKLSQLAQKPGRNGAAAGDSIPPKQQANQAAQLIARLRAEAEERGEFDDPGVPILQMESGSTATTGESAQSAESARPKQKSGGNFNIERTTDQQKVNVDNLFEGLVPDAPEQTEATETAAAAPAAQETESAAAESVATNKSSDEAEPISNDKKMITALDISFDMVNFQDEYYQNNWRSWVPHVDAEMASGVIDKIKEYKIIIGAVIIAAVLIFSDLGGFLSSGSTVQVETVRVGLGNIHQSIIVPGKVVSSMTVDVTSTSAGQITALRVKEGAEVKKGQVLAELENEEAVSDVKRAEGNLLSAQEETALAEKTWKRLRRAFQLGAVSRQAVEEAEARLKTSKAREAVHQEELRSSRMSLNKLSVAAPFAGTITSRKVQVGQWVSPSDAIMTIVDMDKREVEIKVDTADSASIKPGQTVSLSSDAHPGKTWLEKVSRIAPAANQDAMTNTVSVFVSLSAGAPDIRVGQQVDAEVRTSSSSNIIKLPIESLITRNGKTWVAVVEKGKVHFSPVVIGLEDFTHVEILEGVKPRQEVIIPHDANALHEGDKVQVMATRTVE